jgi:hypothetical protein
MAGRRHHIIPRFLQKGFASRTHKNEFFVWVYRKEKKPFESNVNNIIIEKDFYGKDDEEFNADDAITQAEAVNFSPLINQLKNENGSVSSLNTEISKLIAHISIRTKQLRSSFVETADYLTDELDTYMSDFEKMKSFIFSDPELVKSELEKVLETIDAPQELKNSLFPLMLAHLPNVLDEEEKNFEKVTSDYFQMIKSIFPDAIRQGHNRTLKNKPIPSIRAKSYENLNWHVCNSDLPLILGDIGCFFETNGKRRFVPIDSSDNEIISIFLPLTSEKILFGTKYTGTPKIDPMKINKSVARCSYELLICSENSDKYLALTKLIGTWSGIFSEVEKKNVWESIKQDLDRLDS